MPPQNEMGSCCSLIPKPHPQNRSQLSDQKPPPKITESQSETSRIFLQDLSRRLFDFAKGSPTHNKTSLEWIRLLLELLAGPGGFGKWEEEANDRSLMKYGEKRHSEPRHLKEGTLIIVG